MDAIEALTTRVSAGPLTEPAPDEAALASIFGAAMRAADHGRLKPWRFILLRGPARARFGDLMARLLQQNHPESTEEQLARERAKPLRAPLVVAVGAKLNAALRIPVVEQLMAAAAAAQNILVAAHALGYGAVWKTGDVAYDPEIKRSLGLEPADAIVGFLYLGTKAKEMPTPPHHDIANYVTEWSGE